MRSQTTVALTVALCVTSAGVRATQPPATKAAFVTATATILAIDTATRTLTLREETGQEDTVSVGPEVARFNELKVGDKVKATYYESVVFKILKPGEKAGPSKVDGALSRGRGALPVGTLSVQERMTVTVTAIDSAAPSVTVTMPDSRSVTRKVKDKETIEGLKVGDQVDITYTRALVTSIERAQ